MGWAIDRVRLVLPLPSLLMKHTSKGVFLGKQLEAPGEGLESCTLSLQMDPTRESKKAVSDSDYLLL